MDQKVIFRKSTPIQVRYTDIDMMAHVTNSMYLSYCDLARMDYLLHVFEEQIEQGAESLVIASLSIDFMNPIFLNEKIEVQTKIIRIGNKSIQMLQHIVNTNTKDIKASVKTILSGYNYVAKNAIIIPEKWKSKIAAFDADVEYKTKSE